MALLRPELIETAASDHATNRICPVTVKFTQEEHRQVTEYAKQQGQARSEWIRSVVLRELLGQPACHPSLPEILGVRMLLVNVLRPLAAGQTVPLETFDKLLDQISTAKHELAVEIVSEEAKRRQRNGDTGRNA